MLIPVQPAAAAAICNKYCDGRVAGPVDSWDAARQHSAVDLLNAAP